MTTPIFFDLRQSVPDQITYAPSANKPGRFMDLVSELFPEQYGFAGKYLCGFEPISRDDLYLVHSREYVDGVFSGRTLNGFENNDRRVPESCLWTIGSLMAAARAALANPAQPACSPTSGFHHAFHNYGGGFCTFNGLLVVAAKLLRENPELKIGVLDCDYHYGDGTDDILRNLPRLSNSVRHHTAGKHLRIGNKADEYLSWLGEAVLDLRMSRCDLVLYQAGADAHINDPLGGILSYSGMRQRDWWVFSQLRSAIAWNFAGGYRGDGLGDIHTDPVLKLHRLTLRISNESLPRRERWFHV